MSRYGFPRVHAPDTSANITLRGVVSRSYASSEPGPDSTLEQRRAMAIVVLHQFMPGALEVVCVIDTGRGSTGMAAAATQCQRLRRDVVAVAHGEALDVLADGRLELRHCRYIRGGEMPAWHEPQTSEATIT